MVGRTKAAFAVASVLGVAVIVGAAMAFTLRVDSGETQNAPSRPADHVGTQDYAFRVALEDLSEAREALRNGRSVDLRRRDDGYYEIVATQPWRPAGTVEETVPLPTGKPYSETWSREQVNP